MPPPGRAPLRIALLVDRLQQPAWIARALEEIVASGVGEIALVVLNRPPEGGPGGGRRPGGLERVRRWYANRSRLLYAAYLRLDARRNKPDRDPFEPVDLAGLTRGARTIEVAPRRTKFSDYFDDAAVDAITACDLDVALLLGFRILRGRALRIARHGVWSYHHGDNARYRGGPAGFWELYRGDAEVGAILQVLNEDLDGGSVIGTSRSRANHLSLAVNKGNYYWDSAAILGRELAYLRDEGKVGFGVAGPDGGWRPFDRPINKAPHNGAMLILAARIARRLLRGKFRELTRKDHWHILYSASNRTPGVPDDLLYRYAVLPSPEDRYWADPFPVARDGKVFVFVEEQRHVDPKAHLAVLELGPRGLVGASRTILSSDHHLSYPFVFEHEGHWYMMPESAQARSVELFRATRFPDEWERVGPVLTDIAAVDPTLAEIDGRWWLFVATRIKGSSDASALHLYHGRSPLGPWTAHRYNPVKIDVRGARPAGRLFRLGGHWYRPGQNGAPRYGSGIVVHRIDEISPTRFRETAVSQVEPGWGAGLDGCHTVNADGPVTFIDARRRTPRYAPVRSRKA